MKQWADFEQREEARRAAVWQAEAQQEGAAEAGRVEGARGGAVRAVLRIQGAYRRFASEAEVSGDGAAAVYAAGGGSATAAEVRGAVGRAFRRGLYGEGKAAEARAGRAFTRAQALLHGGRGLEEEDGMEALWATLGRPLGEEDACGEWWADAASRV